MSTTRPKSTGLRGVPTEESPTGEVRTGKVTTGEVRAGEVRAGQVPTRRRTSRAPGTPAVFLDKDGTLIDDVPYNVDPSRITLSPGAGPALRSLSDAGFALVVVTNQSGVARGLFPLEALEAVEAELKRLLLPFGVTLTGFHACPHHPAGTVAQYAHSCGCRKPSPGLLTRAAERHELNLAESWLIGDILDDVEAGNRAGCRTVLLDNGGETAWRIGDWRRPHWVASDMRSAAATILELACDRKERGCETISSN